MRYFRIAVLAFIFSGFSSSWADELVASIARKQIHAEKLDAPSLVQTCGSLAWAYSAIHRSFSGFQVQNSLVKKIRTVSLGKSGRFASAMGCQGNSRLVVSTFEKDDLQGKKRFELLTIDKLGRVKKVSRQSQGMGLVQDVSCHNQNCFLIRGDILFSKNLRKWRPIKLPESLNGLNFSRIEALADNSIKLVDLDKATLVTLQKPLKKIRVEDLSQRSLKGKHIGDLLAPRGLSTSPTLDALWVTDAGFKLALALTSSGDFLGAIAPGSKNERFDYPIGIDTLEDLVVVADFFANKIFFFKLQENLLERTPVDLNPEDQLQRSYFNHPAVVKNFDRVRCLSCHDGSQINSLQTLAAHGLHHPLDKELHIKMTLPLKEGRFVTCSSCHDPHHKDVEGTTFSHWGKKLTSKKVPDHLRRSPAELCQECHSQFADTKKNHFDFAKGWNGGTRSSIRVVSCKQCHKIHNAEKHNLRETLPKLCYECHGKKMKPKAHPLQVRSEPKKTVLCISCHALHKADKDKVFARHTMDGVSSTCLDCHEDLKAHVGKNDHLKPKKGKQYQHRWPGAEAVCLDCHHPHRKELDYVKRCLTCHKDRPHKHPKMNPVAYTDRAKGIKLFKNRIACVTCHDQHGISRNKKYLRGRAPLLKFCASCHGEKTIELFDDYHKIYAKKK